MPTFVQEAPEPPMTIDGGMRVHLRNPDRASALVDSFMVWAGQDMAHGVRCQVRFTVATE